MAARLVSCPTTSAAKAARVPRESRVLSILTVLTLALVACDGSSVSNKPELVTRLHEESLYFLATALTLPVYPPNSTACGVAVAAFKLDSAGHVISHQVLQAPDASSRDSLRRALGAWKFSVINDSKTSNKNAVFEIKFTVYFVNFSRRLGEGYVATAMMAPNISGCNKAFQA